MVGKKKQLNPEQLELIPEPKIKKTEKTEKTEAVAEPKLEPVKTRIQMTNKFIIRKR